MHLRSTIEQDTPTTERGPLNMVRTTNRTFIVKLDILQKITQGAYSLLEMLSTHVSLSGQSNPSAQKE